MQKQILRRINIVIVILCALGLFLVGVYLIGNLSRMVEDDTRKALSEISGQVVGRMGTAIANELAILDAHALFVSHFDDIQDPLIFKVLEIAAQQGGYLRIGVALPDGSSKNSDHIDNNIAYREYFQRALRGETVVSEVLASAIDPTIPVIVLAVPIVKDGKTVGVLRGTRRVADYRDILQVYAFQRIGYVYLTQNTGEVILSGATPDWEIFSSDIAFRNNPVFRNNPDLASMAGSMLRNGHGMVVLDGVGGMRYVDYQPLGVNNWYVISVVPADMMMSRVNNIFRVISFIILCVLMIFLIIFAYFLSIRKRKQKAIEKILFEDTLTGLGTWQKMRYDAMVLGQEKKFEYYCLLLVDINGFKLVNDLVGYSTGSEILKSVAAILQSLVTYPELVARVVNDRFALLVIAHDRSRLEKRVEALLARLVGIPKEEQYAPFVGLNLVFSCGIYPIEDPQLSFEIMYERANIALNSIKQQHHSSYTFYDAAMHQAIREKRELQDRFSVALAHDEFEVYLQPKYLVQSQTLAGAEALVRWNHPTRGLLAPGVFIPLFEEDGGIVELDLYVFERVCALLARWMSEGRHVYPVSVNLSRVHLRFQNCFHTFNNLVEKYRIPPNLIELELTETAFLENKEQLNQEIQQLRLQGFLVSIDDFGTGYSSLNLLKNVDVDVIKMDHDFLKDVGNGGKAEIVVRHVLDLASELGITAVAEGVETESQMAYLKRVNCPLAQGFLFARPMPIAQFEQLR